MRHRRHSPESENLRPWGGWLDGGRNDNGKERDHGPSVRGPCRKTREGPCPAPVNPSPATVPVRDAGRLTTGNHAGLAA